MKTKCIFILSCTLFFASAFSQKITGFATLSNAVREQLQILSDLRTQSEKNDDLETFLASYDENAISMPEYQPTLTGITEITAFYKEIFQRQKIKTFERKAEEFIALDSTIIEIGTFQKEYTELNSDTLITQSGKYWSIWKTNPDGSFKLKGDVFGFFILSGTQNF
jgi:ketosteroid isomerase-like protein